MKNQIIRNRITYIGTGLAILSDGAFATSGHANMQFVAISWFICVANDIIAGILVFIALFLQPPKVVAN